MEFKSNFEKQKDYGSNYLEGLKKPSLDNIGKLK